MAEPDDQLHSMVDDPPKAKRDLSARTRAFALRIIRLYQAVPQSGLGRVIGMQLLRSGTSVGAHVAESSHAKSRADFTNKIDGAMQELAETVYWMHLLADSDTVKPEKLTALQAESRELMAIFVSMVKKTRAV
ncbi:MAG TPA: four helix bundle protein [bacterium]|jgi:four helix bundle protein